MKYFLDTEFQERCPSIELISLGIVAEDGREFYAEVESIDPSRLDGWVKGNVYEHLWHVKEQELGFSLWALEDVEYGGLRSRIGIRDAVLDFIDDDESPEFWGYYADYDWVAFCWLFGRMIDLPKGWPMYCRDVKQLADDMGDWIEQEGSNHNALEDARWTKAAYENLSAIRWVVEDGE